jgi:hypothetical protein
MVHSWVVDGGDGLHIWREAVSILNKQSQTVDKGWSSSFRLDKALTTPDHKKTNFLQNVTQGLDLGHPCEYGYEPSYSIKGRQFLD